jgi:hypothetical protein
MKQLEREDPLFYGFCYWLAHEKDFTAFNLLEVIEKPWNWSKEFEEYTNR